jgi:hypothetical protein
MPKNRFKLDIVGFEKQINSLKMKIAQGATEGLENGQDFMKNIMKFYIQESVYDIYTPKMYERTYELRDNVTATVIGDTLFVYVNDSGMDKPNGQWSYPWRVILGNDVYPYDYQNGGSYEEPRDFRAVTKEEFVAHMNQSQKFLQIVKNGIQRRIG